MARRKARPEPDAGPGWLATYGDLVTLLFAFFVMLFAVSSVEAEKFEAFLRGLGPFDNPAATAAISPIGEPVSPDIEFEDTPPDGVDGTAEASPQTRADLGASVSEAITAAGFEAEARVVPDERGLAIALATDGVFFASGSSTLQPEGLRLLGEIVPLIAPLTNPLVIEGHTDNVPLRGTDSNWNLSADRAVAVVDALVEEYGILPSRLTAAGRGEYDPIDPADSPEARARNRRVEIVIIGSPETGPAHPGLDVEVDPGDAIP